MPQIKLSGIFASLTAPFDHEGAIYQAKIRHNVSKWNQVKLAGYAVCGAAGEGPLLTADERVRVWSLTAESAASGRLLIADVSAESVRESASLAGKAAALGYHAVMASAPARYPLDAAGIELYFGALADQSKAPVIVDGVAGESAARLSRHPNVVAVRVRGADLPADLAPATQVLAGSAASLWPALRAGASGAVLRFAAAAPYACITVWEAFRTREEEAAADWQQRIADPDALVSAKYGVAGLKYAMECNGYYGGPCRLPLRGLSPEAKREIASAFENLRG